MWTRRQNSGALFSKLLLAVYLLVVGCSGQTGGTGSANPQADSQNQAVAAKGSSGPFLTLTAPGPQAKSAGLLSQQSVETEGMPPGYALSPGLPLSASTVAHASTPVPTAALPAGQLEEIAAHNPRIAAIIGYSAGGRPIFSYHLGQGSTHIVLVGGIHGGYEWNTILLAYRILDYFLTNPEHVPQPVSLHIIPSANPDGQHAVTNKIGRFFMTDVISDTIPGRFNGNGVDLNRNWDCQWQPTGLWQERRVSGGDRPFSEPESQALSRFLLELKPAAVLFFHSEAEGVYAAGCPETDLASYELSVVYGLAAGYPIYGPFQYYPVTGDAGSWLVTQGIPSISVELTTHKELDWLQNLRGILALLATYEAPRAKPFVPVR